MRGSRVAWWFVEKRSEELACGDSFLTSLLSVPELRLRFSSCSVFLAPDSLVFKQLIEEAFVWKHLILTICSVFVLTGPALTGDMSRAPDKDFNTLEAAGNEFPEGIWSDGTTVWMVDRQYDKIYAYGYLAVISDQGSWSDQAIQDFPIKIRGTTENLKICVRDHECEDGDEISVDVEGRTIFSGEIDNDWDCYTLNVWAGESYAIELTAINGTGYKGNYSYRDENTGEIRVTGVNTETQVWRHRGGAGSKARIIVETVR